ncbi:hypothetical protein RFI_39356 [Reticulomyxa filosa]|uniref:Transmembrane protein n=1 Tax=Reticulomyxa filosa TaxID=46433 RepID=X6L875_RETFI|nr:hypothetical protein RFI_39356 [Reticulomyxa filosa]|eukprot:ETN98157.1 hypothetical protein RFI_39356 [Reticulomyxa filosa]
MHVKFVHLFFSLYSYRKCIIFWQFHILHFVFYLFIFRLVAVGAYQNTILKKKHKTKERRTKSYSDQKFSAKIIKRKTIKLFQFKLRLIALRNLTNVQIILGKKFRLLHNHFQLNAKVEISLRKLAVFERLFVLINWKIYLKYLKRVFGTLKRNCKFVILKIFLLDFIDIFLLEIMLKIFFS